MADQKISALPSATTLDGSEVLPVVQGGTSKKMTTLGFGVVWKVVEIDFGTSPQWSAQFTITDALVTADSSIVVDASGATATGRVGDDWAWDSLAFSAKPAAGLFVLTAYANPGPVVGKRSIRYQIGAAASVDPFQGTAIVHRFPFAFNTPNHVYGKHFHIFIFQVLVNSVVQYRHFFLAMATVRFPKCYD